MQNSVEFCISDSCLRETLRLVTLHRRTTTIRFAFVESGLERIELAEHFVVQLLGTAGPFRDVPRAFRNPYNEQYLSDFYNSILIL